MAEPLGRNRSKVGDEGVPHGCMGGLLHFLDFNQRLHVRKMLAYNKRSGDGRHGERSKSPKVKKAVSIAEGHQVLDRDANILIEDQGRISRNNSGKILTRSLNSRRRPSEQDLNQNTSPMTAQLLRTISIHHLESNNYVENVDHNSHERVSSVNRLPDHLLEKHSLLREKLHSAKEAMTKKKATDAKELEQDTTLHQSKEIFDMMLLLNNNRELLLKVLNDPSSVANFLDNNNNNNNGQKIANAERPLDRSGSFPVTNLSCIHNSEISRLKHKAQKSEIPVYEREDFQAGTSTAKPKIVSDQIFIPKSESRSVDNSKIGSTFKSRNASARFKVIKKRIKEVVNNNNKEGLRISMDGMLHKIPYGSNLSNGMKREKQGLLDRDNSRSKSIKRSHSLNESLDKYSRLLESIPSREYKRTPEKSKLKEEHPKTLGRIFSLPDFDLNSLNKSARYEVFDASQSLKIPLEVDIGEIGQLKTVDMSVHTKESVDEDAKELYASQISDLELYSPENLLNPAEFSDTLDLELKELEYSIYQQAQLDMDASDQFEGERLQGPSELDDYYNFFSVQADPQNEAHFNYVREILWKSGFGTNEFLQAWYSPNQPIDPILFEETECTADDNLFPEYQLLFDLINEVLMEIYDVSSSCYPWLSRFDTRTRPMPSGFRVLEEVWANIRWHLNYEPELDPALDHHAVARDFSKNDGWMDIRYECEDVGLELEDIVMDELIDEVVFELRDASTPGVVFS